MMEFNKRNTGTREDHRPLSQEELIEMAAQMADSARNQRLIMNPMQSMQAQLNSVHPSNVVYHNPPQTKRRWWQFWRRTRS